MKKREPGQLWVTKSGLLAYIMSVEPKTERAFGWVRIEKGSLKFCLWRRDGLVDASDKTQWDLTEPYKTQPFTTWMCKVGEQPPMPAPNEEIARQWARASNGRAFRVIETIE